MMVNFVSAHVRIQVIRIKSTSSYFWSYFGRGEAAAAPSHTTKIPHDGVGCRHGLSYLCRLSALAIPNESAPKSDLAP